jgi:hypothetical protein
MGTRVLINGTWYYILATDFWETGRTTQPVREIGQGKGKSYGAPHPGDGASLLRPRPRAVHMARYLREDGDHSRGRFRAKP